jgi:hypothetical protein
MLLMVLIYCLLQIHMFRERYVQELFRPVHQLRNLKLLYKMFFFLNVYY